MNHKLIKASLAGVAAIAVAAGGSTFAAFSDFADINGNAVGAGILKMTLTPNGSNPGDNTTFDNLKLAPGSYYERQVYVATNDAASTPNAKLFVDISSITGTENGCDTTSEAAVDNCAKDANGNLVDPTGAAGDLINQATLDVASYYPTSTGACDTSKQVLPTRGWRLKDLVAGNFPNASPWLTGAATSPAQLELTGDYYHAAPAPAGFHSSVVPLKELQPGQGMCVMLTVSLPNYTDGSADNNAAQGDGVSFNMRFTVEQSTFSYDAPNQSKHGADYFVP